MKVFSSIAVFYLETEKFVENILVSTSFDPGGLRLHLIKFRFWNHLVVLLVGSLQDQSSLRHSCTRNQFSSKPSKVRQFGIRSAFCQKHFDLDATSNERLRVHPESLVENEAIAKTVGEGKPQTILFLNFIFQRINIVDGIAALFANEFIFNCIGFGIELTVDGRQIEESLDCEVISV